MAKYYEPRKLFFPKELIAEICEKYVPHSKKTGRKYFIRKYKLSEDTWNAAITKALARGSVPDVTYAIMDIADMGPLQTTKINKHHRAAIREGLLCIDGRWVKLTDKGEKDVGGLVCDEDLERSGAQKRPNMRLVK